MQRPPDRRTPTILFTRATSEWISRVNQKHKQLTELHLSPEQTERFDRLAETEFVYSTLRLEGEAVEEEHIARLASGSPVGNANPESGRPALALLESLRAVTSLARARGKAAELSADLLLRLHNLPGAAPGFRRGAGDARRRKPAPAEHLPAMIDSACQWYTAESFTELNPVEQASIVLLRLLEMQPFERANERTALVAASLFTLRSELPPVIITPDMHAAYSNALDEGDRMNTKPMVELIAEAVERSLSKVIEEVGRW
ncbi:MAG: Fic family protein [Acidobacteriota bacterium]